MDKSINPKIFNFFVLTYPLLDIIYTINSRILKVNFPINQGIRVLIMIYLLTKIDRKKSFFIISILFLLLTFGEISYFYSGNMSLSENLSYVTKLLFLIIVIYGIESMLNRGIITPLETISVITSSSVIICLSIVLSKFGLGYNSWDNNLRSGVKGLFSVQNTITISLLIIQPLCLIMFERTKKLSYLAKYLLIFVSLVLIGTKSGLVGAGAILLAQLILILFKTKLTYLKIAISTFLMIFLLAFGVIATDYIREFIKDQQYLYHYYNYTNIYSFLLSNRDLQLDYIRTYIENFKQFNPVWLWGLGYSLANTIIGQGKSDFKAIEMDFHGIYYYSGVWVLLIITIVIFKRYWQSIIYMIKSKVTFMSFSIFLSLSVAIIHALYGGHVLYEALTILYFGIILNISKYELSMTKNKKKVL